MVRWQQIERIFEKYTQNRKISHRIHLRDEFINVKITKQTKDKTGCSPFKVPLL